MAEQDNDNDGGRGTVDPDTVEVRDGETLSTDGRLDVTEIGDAVVVTMTPGYVEHETALVEAYGWEVVEKSRGESGKWLVTVERADDAVAGGGEKLESETKREFEVGVEGFDGDFEHITVEAESPEEAYDKAVDEVQGSIFFDLEDPVHAYQAYELEKGVTHTP